MPDLKGTSITWLGHATVLIVTAKGTTILVDPFIEHNPKYPKSYSLPEKIDLLLITHGHMDHIADAVPVLKKHGPIAVGMVELIDWLQTKGVKEKQGIGMNLGGSHKHADVTLALTEARHSSSITDGDKTLYGGNPAGFIIAIDGGPVLYHAGDTTVFSDMQLIRDLHHPNWPCYPSVITTRWDRKARRLPQSFSACRRFFLSTSERFHHWSEHPSSLRRNSRVRG